MDERIASGVEFAKAYGGFKQCRLFAEFYNRAPLDLSKLTAADGLSDEEMAAIVLEILKENTHDYYHCTTMPWGLEFVEE